MTISSTRWTTAAPLAQTLQKPYRGRPLWTGHVSRTTRYETCTEALMLRMSNWPRKRHRQPHRMPIGDDEDSNQLYSSRCYVSNRYRVSSPNPPALVTTAVRKKLSGTGPPPTAPGMEVHNYTGLRGRRHEMIRLAAIRRTSTASVFLSLRCPQTHSAECVASPPHGTRGFPPSGMRCCVLQDRICRYDSVPLKRFSA